MDGERGAGDCHRHMLRLKAECGAKLASSMLSTELHNEPYLIYFYQTFSEVMS